MITIISAPRDGGKTKYVQSLSTKGSFGGFISVAESEQKQRFFLLNLATLEKRLLMQRGPELKWEVFQETFDWANEELGKLDCGPVILDEVGMFEIRGKGFSSGLLSLLKKNLELVLCVRDSHVLKVVKHFGLKDYKIINALDFVNEENK